VRLLWQNISTRDVPGMPEAGTMWAALEKHIAGLAFPHNSFDFDYLPRASYFVASKYMELLNDACILDRLIKNEEGHGAAIIGCFNDPGLQEARESLSIPVIGVGEAGMLLACMLGRNFGVVTVRRKLIPIIEDNVRRYGLESRLIRRDPIRSCELDEKLYPAMFDLPARTAVPPFEEQARLMAEDGAEVVVVGCASLGPALSLAGYNKVEGTRVPVVNATAAAVKFAEAAAYLSENLGLSTSKALKYQSLPRPIFDGIRASLGFE